MIVICVSFNKEVEIPLSLQFRPKVYLLLILLLEVCRGVYFTCGVGETHAQVLMTTFVRQTFRPIDFT